MSCSGGGIRPDRAGGAGGRSFEPRIRVGIWRGVAVGRGRCRRATGIEWAGRRIRGWGDVTCGWDGGQNGALRAAGESRKRGCVAARWVTSGASSGEVVARVAVGASCRHGDCAQQRVEYSAGTRHRVCPCTELDGWGVARVSLNTSRPHMYQRSANAMRGAIGKPVVSPAFCRT